jgi:hypothetical protein
MREYIRNLTDTLIRQRGFCQLVDGYCGPRNDGVVLNAIKHILEEDDICHMRPETLGKIMGNLNVGDLSIGKVELFTTLHFSGDGEDLLREMVALCLACVIRDRLSPFGGPCALPQYQRKTPR